MNTKRNYTLDWIRVFAMGGILLDHYLCALGSQCLNNIGMQIGVGGGNCLLHYLGLAVWT